MSDPTVDVNPEAVTPGFEQHPLTGYLENLDELIHALVVERQRLQAIVEDAGADPQVQAQASADVAKLESRVNLLMAQRNAFIIGLVTATQPPNDKLVQESKQMAANLATVVVQANRTRALLQIADDFLTAAQQAITGQVPPPAAGGGTTGGGSNGSGGADGDNQGG